MTIIAFGDSNTYGYDPRGYLGGRYDAYDRWVDILATETGWMVRNLGENGRGIPAKAPDFLADADLLIVMLGINDLLQGRNPEEAVLRLESFLSDLILARDKVLLIAPPPMALGAWVSNEQLVAASKRYAQLCKELAKRMGVRFADAGAWGVSPAYDGVHFTEQGHRAFAAGLLEELK